MGHIDESLAVVSFIAQNAGQSGKLGKKAVQKLVHLVSVLGKVPTKYQFRLYTYGPFSRELAGDLDVLESIQALHIQYNDEKSAYEIQAGPQADAIIRNYADFLNKHNPQLENIIAQFGNRLAKQLELTSTLLHIIDRKLVEDTDDDNQVINKFSEIKPHYQTREIKEGLQELRRLLS